MNALQLEQVIVFTRHGIRTSLPNTVDFLNTVTPKQWSKWDCKLGYLTTRGGILESYFGDYLMKWLNSLNFNLTTNDIFIYANSLHRTVATAQFFSLGAFSGLDIAINHRYPIERMDPIFDPIIRQDNADFKQQVFDDLRRYTHSTQLIETLDQQLKPAYQLLSDILDYKHSILYKQYQCELFELPTQIDIVANKEPILLGPLAIGTAVADAFTLQYYSAFAQHEIAWGSITDTKQWALITEIKNQYINLLFRSPVLANHIAQPLVKLVHQIMDERQYKFALLSGHDSNIACLMRALNFKDYQLPEQFETTPIGGKVVLQRWRDMKNQQSYFKVEYIYQTFEQLHLAQPLSLNTPPKHITLQLADAQPNGQGYYLWQDIEARIKQYLYTHST